MRGLFLLVLTIFTFNAFSQQREIKEGDAYFKLFQYHEAAKKYQEAVVLAPSNYYAKYRLAESYYYHFDYTEALPYYKEIAEKMPDAFPLVRYKYASTLRAKGEYLKAKNNLEIFLEKYADINKETQLYKEKAVRDLKGCEMALEKLSEPKRDFNFERLTSPLNSEYHDYAPVIFDHDSSLIVTSTRSESLGGDDKMLGESFSDMYRFHSSPGDWSEFDDKDQFNALNTRFNELAGSFTADGNKFYFTRCDHLSKGAVKEYLCGIYVSKKSKGKWTKAVELNHFINQKGEWNGQPSISPNGDTLFFVSKRPGGFGMNDIWFSTSKGEDKWQPARNCGPHVNSPYTEQFPNYYSKKGVLFFSSNGLGGFGGLDIYKAKAPLFNDVEDLGLPFNSSRDDFSFVAGEKIGYLSSNREGGQGGDDIYRFDIESEEEAVVAEIDMDEVKEQFEEENSEVDPAISLVSDQDESNSINDSESITDLNNSGTLKSITVVGVVKSLETNDPVEDVEELLVNEDGEVLQTTHSNEKGEFKFDNLPVDENYEIRIENKEGTSLVDAPQYKVENLQVKASSVEVTRSHFENIYFDFDQYVLRPEGKQVLIELVNYYKKNNEVQIEINAYTDSFGSDEYNTWLSNKRGRTAYDFLVMNGVNKTAIVIRAKGEEVPLASNNNPVGRQLNRRVEFNIIGGPGYEAENMVYIVEPKMTLYSLAERFDMSVSELKELNAMNDNELIAFEPVRVRRIGDADIVDPISMDRGNVDMKKRDYKKELKRLMAYHQYYDRKQPNIKLNPGQDFYVVQPKNTLYRISKLYGMTIEDLMKMNDLKSDTIYAGEPIKVLINFRELKNNEYLVKEKDTLSSIASKFGLKEKELEMLNQIHGYVLTPNMILKTKE